MKTTFIIEGQNVSKRYFSNGGEVIELICIATSIKEAVKIKQAFECLQQLRALKTTDENLDAKTLASILLEN